MEEKEWAEKGGEEIRRNERGGKENESMGRGETRKDERT